MEEKEVVEEEDEKEAKWKVQQREDGEEGKQMKDIYFSPLVELTDNIIIVISTIIDLAPTTRAKRGGGPSVTSQMAPLPDFLSLEEKHRGAQTHTNGDSGNMFHTSKF